MKAKRFIALFMSLLMVFAFALVPAFAEDEEPAVEAASSGSFSFCNFNIAGLPAFKGSNAKKARQERLGKLVAKEDYDIVCTQEIFEYDAAFASGLGYPYRTAGAASCVFGDGMSVFSKTPLYNVYHWKWNKTGGQIWEGDTMSQKGVMKCVAEIADGVYVNVYVLHADAYGGLSSQEARADNFRQAAEIINADESGRPVIVTGDFNSAFHFSNSVENMYTQLLEPCGLKDAWVELCNGGSYTDFSSQSGSYWGNWDSVEHILYRNGDKVSIEPVEHRYLSYEEDGELMSDHASESVVFNYTASEKASSAGLAPAPSDYPLDVFKAIRIIFKDLAYGFSHWDEVKVMVKYMNDTETLYAQYVV